MREMRDSASKQSILVQSRDFDTQAGKTLKAESRNGVFKVKASMDCRPRQVSKERFEARDCAEPWTALSAAAGRGQPETEASGAWA